MSSSLKGSHYKRILILFYVCTKAWPHLNQSPISCSALSTASLPWQILRPTWGRRITYKLPTHECQYLYTVVSSDCSRLAGCRVGLSKHHPDMSLFRFWFLALTKPASLDSTLPFPCHCHHWAWVHVGHLGVHVVALCKLGGRSTFDSQVLGRMIWLTDPHSAPWDEPHRVSSSWFKWFDLEAQCAEEQ